MELFGLAKPSIFNAAKIRKLDNVGGERRRMPGQQQAELKKGKSAPRDTLNLQLQLRPERILSNFSIFVYYRHYWYQKMSRPLL